MFAHLYQKTVIKNPKVIFLLLIITYSKLCNFLIELTTLGN